MRQAVRSQSSMWHLVVLALLLFVSHSNAHAVEVHIPRVTSETPSPDCQIPVVLNSLLPSHPRVYFWARLTQVKRGDRLTYRWYGPRKRLLWEKKITRTRAQGSSCTFSWIKMANSNNVRRFGKWAVELHINGKRKARQSFVLLSPLVKVQLGNVPVILSAPHGGWLRPPRVSERPAGKKKPDGKTYSVIWDVATEFTRITGKKPYVVAARIERKYIDLNREYVHRSPFRATEALSDPDAVPYYLAYHQTIRGFINEIKRTWRTGALIDIHGQSQNKKVIFRGTKDGRTLHTLNRQLLYTRDGLFGSLVKQEYSVLPSTATAVEESYNGGFTVEAYGAQNTTNFNAIQVEIGKNFRQDKTWKNMAQSLGKATARMYQRFLPQNRK